MTVSKNGIGYAELKTFIAASNAGSFNVSSRKALTLPLYDVELRKTTIGVAQLARVHNGAEEFTVLVAYHIPEGSAGEFKVSCGDRFLDKGDGNLSQDDADARCAEALKDTGLPASLLDEMKANFATLGETTRCQFNMKWRRDRELCDHTQAFLHLLNKENPNFVDDLKQQYENLFEAAKSAPAPKGDTFELHELAFRVPVLFVGDRGAGKTVTARAFARDNGYYKVELGCHEGLESTEMLGYSMPAPNGEMVWLDGALSEAFRAAKTKKVVLIIDELLRTRMRELSILLTALSPDQGMYRVRTNRILSVEDGVAKVETLEAPVANLCIVATTNVGSEYAVDEIDPALAERFVPIRKDTTEAELKRILSLVGAEQGFKAALITKMVLFYKKMLEARERGLVSRTPTTRTMCRALELADTDTDVVRALRTQILLWVATTSEGLPVKEQVTTVETLLKSIFK